MLYNIHHITHYRYDGAITNNVTEICKRPLDGSAQRCLSYEVATYPIANLSNYRDPWGNHVDHFSVIKPHRRLEIVARTLVEVLERPLPDPADYTLDSWDSIMRAAETQNFWDFLHQSQFVAFSERVRAFASEMGVGERIVDPYRWLLQVNGAIHGRFDYKPNTTTVDSTIDELLESGAGVCQDFTHLMLAVLRIANIPARYISGYLFHRKEDDSSAEDATHAWVEAWLPEFGWLGLDPTNNILAQERHIRVAIGRDYADVPPTRGVFRGEAESTLDVMVDVTRAEPEQEDELAVELTGWAAVDAREMQVAAMQQQQQQQ